jgi:TetR/AcrR family transcriptional regulator
LATAYRTHPAGGAGRPADGRRNAERSRSAILDAAEAVFAERGFEGAAMAAIGSAAGLSRGAPGYFFGSKEQLYRAVLGRLFEISGETVGGAVPDANLPESMADAIGRLTTFVDERPAFLRILEWEALSGDRRLSGIPEHLATLAVALRQVSAGLQLVGRESLDTRHLVLSLIALCLFPQSHPALVRDLGLDPGPGFAEARTRQIVDLVLFGLLPR